MNSLLKQNRERKNAVVVFSLLMLLPSVPVCFFIARKTQLSFFLNKKEKKNVPQNSGLVPQAPSFFFFLSFSQWIMLSLRGPPTETLKDCKRSKKGRVWEKTKELPHREIAGGLCLLTRQNEGLPFYTNILLSTSTRKVSVWLCVCMCVCVWNGRRGAEL